MQFFSSQEYQDRQKEKAAENANIELVKLRAAYPLPEGIKRWITAGDEKEALNLLRQINDARPNFDTSRGNGCDQSDEDFATMLGISLDKFLKLCEDLIDYMHDRGKSVEDMGVRDEKFPGKWKRKPRMVEVIDRVSEAVAAGTIKIGNPDNVEDAITALCFRVQAYCRHIFSFSHLAASLLLSANLMVILSSALDLVFLESMLTGNSGHGIQETGLQLGYHETREVDNGCFNPYRIGHLYSQSHSQFYQQRGRQQGLYKKHSRRLDGWSSPPKELFESHSAGPQELWRSS